MLIDKFIETINEYKLFEPKDKVLVAVSGGPDSTALLNLLAAVQDKYKLSLHVAHLNHLIRKNDADLDVRYVQDLAQRLKIPITVESMDVPAFAKKEKLSLETAARQLRYDFFAWVAKRIGANKIAVGHTADDNVETFLMRLLRGAGLRGLSGIPPKRGKIVRPLIKTYRKDIEDYVGSLKLVPRRDYTNYESKYMRNRVRLKLIPQLKLYNLNIKEIILQTILLVTDDADYLETKAEEALAQVLVSRSENEMRINLALLRRLEEPIQKHLLREAIKQVKGNLSDLTYTHIYDILEKLSATTKWELHLPGGIFVIGNREILAITHQKPQGQEKISFQYVLSVPGEIVIAECGKRLRAGILESFDLDDLVENENTAYLDLSVLSKHFIVRNREQGDRFTPLGMKGSKKLQDYFIDEKVPAELRDAIPVVESGGKIVWVAGLRLDERAKVTKKTKKVVKLELL
ncbi:MAG: tRNA lysidine(34) synthetase TilS [bacterium]